MFGKHASRRAQSLRLGTSFLPLTVLVMTAAQAQDASQNQSLEEVVVTGFRESLTTAINAKRTETGVVDVIKSEDIAAFPDLNLAESLQRIPGVSISRVSGEGREISVRGLGPQYTMVRLDGMSALATSGSSDSGGGAGTNRSRGFDFNIFASELFNSLTVRKTAAADVEEGSLGATVDLATPRPFDYQQPTFVVSAKAGYNDLSGHIDPRFAVLGTHNWFGGKLGTLLSIAYGERHIIEDGFSTTRWDNGASQNGFCSPAGFDTNAATAGVQSNPSTTATTCGSSGPARLPNTPGNDAAWTLADAATTFLPRIPGYNSFEEGEKRLGVTGSVQYQMTDDTLITLDGMFAKLDQKRNEKALQALGMSRNGTGKPEMTVTSFTVDGSNNVATANFNNVDMRTQSRYVAEGTEFQQYTATIAQSFGKLKINGLVGISDSHFDTSNDTTLTFDAANVQNYSIDFTKNNRLPLITFAMDPTQAANWSANNGTSEVRLRPGVVDNKYKAAKLDFEYEVMKGLSAKLGGDFRDYTYNSEEQRRFSETVIDTLTPTELASVSTEFTGFGRDFDLPTGTISSWLVPDVQKYAALKNIYCNCGIYAISSAQNSSARGNTNYVQEVDTSGYAMVMYNFDLLEIPFRGDAGARFVNTTQSSGGYAAVGGVVQWVTSHRSYTNFLPSMNLAADITDEAVIRVAAAKTIARPDLSSLSPGGDVSVQGANRTFSTGNPLLNPTKSTNVDLSFEYYPEKGALYSLGLFYKSIANFAQTLRQSGIIYNTLGLPDSLLTGTTAVPTDPFDVTQPVNSPGGDLKGAEFNAQQPFNFLPGLLGHTGGIVNVTWVESSIAYITSTTPGAPTVSATLVGLSKYSANGTLYYEDNDYSIRGSVAYRSGYLTQVPGRNNNFVEGTNATINVDMEATYNLSDSLKLTLEGLNLTDEPADTYVDTSNRVNSYFHSGRQFYLGVRYTY